MKRWAVSPLTIKGYSSLEISKQSCMLQFLDPEKSEPSAAAARNQRDLRLTLIDHMLEIPTHNKLPIADLCFGS